MSIAAERKEYYLNRIEEKNQGIVRGIQLGHVFPKLASIIPVIPQGYQVLLTANSGIGIKHNLYFVGVFIIFV